MAGIDKLYLKDYWDLKDLRLWANIYYPKLLIWFYDHALTIDYDGFYKYKVTAAKNTQKIYKNQWNKYSPDGTITGAVANLMQKYDFTEDEAYDQARDMYTNYQKSLSDLQYDTDLPVMNTPFKIDRKLKWICPLPCIREYLKNQCGVKEHWYYRLFWRGKQHFII